MHGPSSRRSGHRRSRAGGPGPTAPWRAALGTRLSDGSDVLFLDGDAAVAEAMSAEDCFAEADRQAR